MQNYLSKQNLGIPASMICSSIYLLSYALSKSYIYLVIVLIFSAVIFMLNFEDKVKYALKQGLTLTFLSYIINWILSLVKTILSWFSLSNTTTNYETFFGNTASEMGTADILNEIVNIIADISSILILITFIILLISALQGKDKRIKLLNKITSERKICKVCGCEVTEDAAFCTKCGSNLKLEENNMLNKDRI